MSPEETKNFDAAMATFAPATSAAMAAAYDFSQFGTVMDVGGGNGAILIGLLAANPALRGIVFDRAASAERARAKLAEAGLAARSSVVGGDFFQAVPGGRRRDPAEARDPRLERRAGHAILKNCHRAIRPGAKLLIAEGVYPPQIDQSLESRGAAANDVNMLVVSGGRQRSEEEFRSLYRAAGFELTKIVPTLARLCVIEGVRR